MKFRYSMERQIHFATNWRSSTSLMFGRVGWISDERFEVKNAPGDAGSPDAEASPEKQASAGSPAPRLAGEIEVSHQSAATHPFRLPRPKLPIQRF